MAVGFRYENYGTFTGPAGVYDYDDSEPIWHTLRPEDVSFKLSDLSMILFNNEANYVGFYCNGTSTQLMTLRHSTGNIPSLRIQATNTIVNGDTLINGNIIANGTINANGTILGPTITRLDAAINSKKGFDIQHPNKKNHRLRHICVEGPESAIYFRGKLVDNNIIEIPDYWNGLVDLETITVNLTQIGYSQDLVIEKIEWGKRIIIKSGNGSNINCYYQVWADRLGEKLIVEYDGQTPADYPGDNTEYSIAGYDYDRR